MKDYVGKKAGRLTVISLSTMRFPKENSKRKRAHATVRCDCGKEFEVNISSLWGRESASCGCYRKDNPPNIKHGLSQTKLNEVWRHMIHRCYVTKNKAYKIYGGIGVAVCDEWRNDFTAFYNWGIENGYSDGLSIDRFPDKNGNYEPSNCRWATRKEQNANRRTTMLNTQRAKHIRILSKTQKINTLATLYNVSRSAITSVIRNVNWASV